MSQKVQSIASQQPADGDSLAGGNPGYMSSTAYIPSEVSDVEGTGSPQEDQQDEPVELISPALIRSALEPTFITAFNAVAAARGPHWRLENFQLEALLAGWTPILQLLLSRLGNQEQVLLGAALISTTGIIGGKLYQDAIRRASSTESIKTPKSGGSSAFSGSGDRERRPEQNNSFEAHDD